MPDSSPETSVSEATATETNTDAKIAETSTATQDVKAAESSTAEPGAKGDMLSAVKAALKPETEKTPSSDTQEPKPAAATSDEAPKEGDEEEDDSGDFTEEELSLFKRKARKRVEGIIGKNKDLEAQVAQLGPKAETLDKITRFVEDQNLTKDEVNQGFDVMAKLKNNPRAAFEALKPIYAGLQQMFGETLPDDLQTDVNLGRITEDRARELASARTDNLIAQQNSQRTEARETERRQREGLQTLQRDVGTKMSEWERSKAKSDPDWKLKQARLQERIELDVMKNGPLTSVEDALARADKALAGINDEFKSLAPRRQAVTPTTEVASTRSTPQPASMLEAMKQAAGG